MKKYILNEIIAKSKVFKKLLMDNEYLIYSPSLILKPFYIISSYEENYLHITGVTTKLNPKDFYKKCYENKIMVDDFDYYFDKSARIFVSRTTKNKISALSYITLFFSGINPIYIQENYKKGRIRCLFATTDKTITIGFSKGNKSAIQTLLLGPRLDDTKSIHNVDLLLSRKKGTTLFTDIIINKDVDFSTLPEEVKVLIDPKLFEKK